MHVKRGLRLRRVIFTAGVAGMLSGIPSTVITLARREPLLPPVRAAGALVGRPSVPAGIAVHSAVSLGWTAVMSVFGDRRQRMPAGIGWGLAIATIDLGLIGRHVPAIRSIPQLRQWLDHVAFGAIVTFVLPRA